jgi:hypothetical protein
LEGRSSTTELPPLEGTYHITDGRAYTAVPAVEAVKRTLDQAASLPGAKWPIYLPNARRHRFAWNYKAREVKGAGAFV